MTAPTPESRSPPAGGIAVIHGGQGPEVLLVHGGASPQTTWSALAPLGERWTLALAHRRGFPPSPPPPGGHQDFDVDADDLEPLLDCHPHLVAHSYGAVGAVIAATRRPNQVRSLTLIEPALFLPENDPDVAHFRRIGEAALTHGLETEATILREFSRSPAHRYPMRGRFRRRSSAAFDAPTAAGTPLKPARRSRCCETPGYRPWSPQAITTQR